MAGTLTWKEIMDADTDQIHGYCEQLGLSDRGDEDVVRERLLRHVLSISLPTGELLFQGKLNINRAAPEEMRLWPHMGDSLIKNIIEYRNRYGRFTRIDDLLNVKGVGENLFKRIAPFMDVSGETRIRIAGGVRIETDIEMLRLEEEIRQKAWDMNNLQDAINLDMESLSALITGARDGERDITRERRELERLTGRIATHEKRLGTLRERLRQKMEAVNDLERQKKEELAEVRAERLRLEDVLPWKEVIMADEGELRALCERHELSTRGDPPVLRDRLMRRILNINLPLRELLLEGKLNINTATPEEMSLWPYMGDVLVSNIIAYREKYGRFNRVEDLLNVTGVGENLFRKLIQFVDVSGRTHIKVKQGTRAEVDMEFLRLEEDIRNRAWEIGNLRETVDLEMDTLSTVMGAVRSHERELISGNRQVEKIRGTLSGEERRLYFLKDRLMKKLEAAQEVQQKMKQEIDELSRERLQLEKVLPWRTIILADLEELREQCVHLGLSPRGDEASLRDRLMRHILTINPPLGDLLLEGKLNINTATPEEMGLWPYMGDTLVANIMAYRNEYGRFNSIDDLMSVKGVGENLFRKLVHFVDVTGRTHIKVKHGTRAEANLALIRLEDDIRNKAWEVQDIRDHLDLDIEYLRKLMDGMGSERNLVSDHLSELENARERILLKETEMTDLRSELTRQIDSITLLRQDSEGTLDRIRELGEDAEQRRLALQEESIELEDMRRRLDEERMDLNELRAIIQQEQGELDGEREEIIILRDQLRDIQAGLIPSGIHDRTGQEYPTDEFDEGRQHIEAFPDEPGTGFRSREVHPYGPDTRQDEPDGRTQEDLDTLRQELATRLDELDIRQEDLDARQQNLDAIQQDIDAREQNLDAIQQDIDAREQNLDTIQQDIDARQQNLDTIQQDIDARLDELETRQQEMDGQRQALDARDRDLEQREREMKELSDRIGMDLKDLADHTIDIPVMVMRDPDDPDPTDDMVILESTDWLVKKSINVHYQGEKLSDMYSQVTFKDVPMDKTYNILVDTGERKYVLMKNLKPGGEA